MLAVYVITPPVMRGLRQGGYIACCIPVGEMGSPLLAASGVAQELRLEFIRRTGLTTQEFLQLLATRIPGQAKLQSLPAKQEMDAQQGDHRGAARAGEFSLHAGIEDPEVIAKILAHLARAARGRASLVLAGRKGGFGWPVRRRAGGRWVSGWGVWPGIRPAGGGPRPIQGPLYEPDRKGEAV